MSKKLTIKEITNMQKKTIDKLNDFITELISNENNKKRGILLLYWIPNYIKMIKREKEFKSTELIKYNKGDIISVDLGFKIGCEFGGRHFAVVLDKFNGQKSNIITVAPLTSQKINYKENCFTFRLQKGLYDLYQEKFDKLIEKCKSDVNYLTEKYNAIDERIDDEFFQITISKIHKNLDSAQILKDELEHLKAGTVVNISQITTISKIRILNPKYTNDTLKNIKLIDEDLNNLDKKIKYLYIGKKFE